MEQIIDSEMFLDLVNKFAMHEEWIQKGCSSDDIPDSTILGYFALASQNGDAYGLFRRSMLPYLSEARGNQSLFRELCQCITDCEEKYPEDMTQFWMAHNAPSEKFKGQWNNLFDRFENTDLTHENCFKYQQKYEIEYPLVVFTQLRQLCSGNGFDEDLDRFRDAKRKLKKGVMANYIVDGFNSYPKVKEMLTTAYDSKLRNIIGHNTYIISDDNISSLEENYNISMTQFWQKYIKLQEVQNAILWLLSKPQNTNHELSKYGVASIGFDLDGIDSDFPSMYIFQINPFRHIDINAKWLEMIQFSIENRTLITTLSNVDKHCGYITDKLNLLLIKIREVGQIRVNIIPIMPCIHEDCDSVITKWGTYCQYGKQHVSVVPATVKWMDNT